MDKREGAGGGRGGREGVGGGGGGGGGGESGRDGSGEGGYGHNEKQVTSGYPPIGGLRRWKLRPYEPFTRHLTGN